jgi:hypothetical protein
VRPRVAHALAALILLAGLARLAVLGASPLTWAVPLQPGEIAPGWRLIELRRTEAVVQLTLDDGARRAGLRLTHRSDRAGPQPLAFAGRYRLDPADDQPPPPDVIDAVAAPVADWDTTWPQPPAFVRPTAWDPAPGARLQASLVDVAVVLGVAASVALLPELAALTPAWTWLTAAGAGLIGAGTSLLLGLTGLWHSNQHGHDRLSDLAHGAPAWDANLALVHGTAYYALMSPLVGGDPDGGRSAVGAALFLSTLALLAWLPALRLGLADPARGVAAVVLLAGSVPWLRLAGTDSMYVPALLACGALATATEALRHTGRRRWLLLLLPWLVVASQSRGELMLLAPLAVLWRLVTAGPQLVLRLATTPSGLLGALLVALASLPRGLSLLAMERPEGSRRGAPYLDPRLVGLAGLVLVGVAAWAPVRRRLGDRAVGAVAAVGAVVVAALWGLGRRADPPPWGFEAAFQVHAALDPRLTAPWLAALPLLGLAALARRDPTALAFLAVAFGSANALYVVHHDCWSTYLSVSLATTPLVAAAAAAALPRRATPWAAALAATGLVWSLPWLTTPWPKVAQDRLLRAIPAAVPAGATLVWLGPTDAPPDAADQPGAAQRVDLPRHAGDRYLVLPLAAWQAGAAPPDRPTVFVGTLDCHRPILSRSPPWRAWLGDEVRAWDLLQVAVVSAGPRYTIDGLVPAANWLDPACAAARAVGVPLLGPVPVQAGTQGSLWDEAHGDAVTLGLWTVPARP